jgi:dolichyl-phosphate-mannose--protein O-mannosyl transferase
VPLIEHIEVYFFFLFLFLLLLFLLIFGLRHDVVVGLKRSRLEATFDFSLEGPHVVKLVYDEVGVASWPYEEGSNPGLVVCSDNSIAAHAYHRLIRE